MTIRDKAISGFGWTAFEGIFSQGVIFLVGIVLARLLTPEDFGLIGIVTVFIAITSSLVEGGFSEALIRKTNVDQIDFSTVFYTNMAISVALYALLIMFSENIASYFEETELRSLLNYSGIVIIINAICIVQNAMLTIRLNFRILSIINIVSSLGSAIVALLMAYWDYGVWSLVSLSILRPLIRCILLIINGKWKPVLIFSLERFKELFGFGYKLLISTIINTVYKNIYYFLIGKFFSPTALGYYTRADQFQAPFSVNITRAISNISFPILASLQNDRSRFKTVFIKFLKFSVLINFSILLAIAAIAKPLVFVTIGEKWSASIFYLQLLCIPGMLYPLQKLNLNLLTSLGYSNLLLKIEILKKVILIPLVLFTVSFSIEIVLYGLVVFSIIEYFINSYFAKKLIDYSVFSQIKDILPFLLISIFTFLPMFLISFTSLKYLTMLIVQVSVGLLTFYFVNEIIKTKEYLEIKTKALEVAKKIFNERNKKN
jgi:O-antigen/teichoic acid export membrane protein